MLYVNVSRRPSFQKISLEITYLENLIKATSFDYREWIIDFRVPRKRRRGFTAQRTYLYLFNYTSIQKAMPGFLGTTIWLKISTGAKMEVLNATSKLYILVRTFSQTFLQNTKQTKRR